MNQIGKKYKFKITVIGDGMVGKTTLIQRYTKGSFRKDYVKTIGAQFSVFDKEINGDKIRLLFWDIAGQVVERNFLQNSFYSKSRAAIIVYSLEETDLGINSFKHIVDWYQDISKHCGEIPVVIFANKADLIDENSFDDSKIQKLVEEHNFISYYKTSAETGDGVVEAFNAIIEKLYHKYKSLSTVL
jgi:small GTP-binding protein